MSAFPSRAPFASLDAALAPLRAEVGPSAPIAVAPDPTVVDAALARALGPTVSAVTGRGAPAALGICAGGSLSELACALVAAAAPGAIVGLVAPAPFDGVLGRFGTTRTQAPALCSALLAVGVAAIEVRRVQGLRPRWVVLGRLRDDVELPG